MNSQKDNQDRPRGGTSSYQAQSPEPMEIVESATAENLHESPQSPTVASPDGTGPGRLERRYTTDISMQPTPISNINHQAIQHFQPKDVSQVSKSFAPAGRHLPESFTDATQRRMNTSEVSPRNAVALSGAAGKASVGATLDAGRDGDIGAQDARGQQAHGAARGIPKQQILSGKTTATKRAKVDSNDSMHDQRMINTLEEVSAAEPLLSGHAGAGSKALESVAERTAGGATQTIGERSSILAIGMQAKVGEQNITEKSKMVAGEGSEMAMRTVKYPTRDSEELDEKFEVFVIGVDEATTQKAMQHGSQIKPRESDSVDLRMRVPPSSKTPPVEVRSKSDDARRAPINLVLHHVKKFTPDETKRDDEAKDEQGEMPEGSRSPVVVSSHHLTGRQYRPPRVEKKCLSAFAIKPVPAKVAPGHEKLAKMREVADRYSFLMGGGQRRQSKREDKNIKQAAGMSSSADLMQERESKQTNPLRASRPQESRMSHEREMARLKSQNTFDKVESLLNLQGNTSQMLLLQTEELRNGHSPALATALNMADPRRASQSNHRSSKAGSYMQASYAAPVHTCPIHGPAAIRQLHASYSARGQEAVVDEAAALAREASLQMISAQLHRTQGSGLSRLLRIRTQDGQVSAAQMRMSGQRGASETRSLAARQLQGVAQRLDGRRESAPIVSDLDPAGTLGTPARLALIRHGQGRGGGQAGRSGGGDKRMSSNEFHLGVAKAMNEPDTSRGLSDAGVKPAPGALLTPKSSGSTASKDARHKRRAPSVRSRSSRWGAGNADNTLTLHSPHEAAPSPSKKRPSKKSPTKAAAEPPSFFMVQQDRRIMGNAPLLGTARVVTGKAGGSAVKPNDDLRAIQDTAQDNSAKKGAKRAVVQEIAPDRLALAVNYGANVNGLRTDLLIGQQQQYSATAPSQPEGATAQPDSALPPMMQHGLDGADSTPHLVLVKNAVSSQLSIRRPALSDDASPKPEVLQPAKQTSDNAPQTLYRPTEFLQIQQIEDEDDELDGQSSFARGSVAARPLLQQKLFAADTQEAQAAGPHSPIESEGLRRVLTQQYDQNGRKYFVSSGDQLDSQAVYEGQLNEALDTTTDKQGMRHVTVEVAAADGEPQSRPKSKGGKKRTGSRGTEARKLQSATIAGYRIDPSRLDPVASSLIVNHLAAGGSITSKNRAGSSANMNQTLKDFEVQGFSQARSRIIAEQQSRSNMAVNRSLSSVNKHIIDIIEMHQNSFVALEQHELIDGQEEYKHPNIVNQNGQAHLSQIEMERNRLRKGKSAAAQRSETNFSKNRRGTTGRNKQRVLTTEGLIKSIVRAQNQQLQSNYIMRQKLISADPKRKMQRQRPVGHGKSSSQARVDSADMSAGRNKSTKMSTLEIQARNYSTNQRGLQLLSAHDKEAAKVHSLISPPNSDILSNTNAESALLGGASGQDVSTPLEKPEHVIKFGVEATMKEYTVKVQPARNLAPAERDLVVIDDCGEQFTNNISPVPQGRNVLKGRSTAMLPHSRGLAEEGLFDQPETNMTRLGMYGGSRKLVGCAPSRLRGKTAAGPRQVEVSKSSEVQNASRPYSKFSVRNSRFRGTRASFEQYISGMHLGGEAAGQRSGAALRLSQQERLREELEDKIFRIPTPSTNVLNKNAQDDKHRSVGSVGVGGRGLSQSSGVPDGVKPPPLKLPIGDNKGRDVQAVRINDRVSKSSQPGNLGTEVASTKLLSSRKLSPKHREKTPDLLDTKNNSKSPKTKQHPNRARRRSLVFSERSAQQQQLAEAELDDGGKHHAVARRDRYVYQTRRQGFNKHLNNLKRKYRQPSAAADRQATLSPQTKIMQVQQITPVMEVTSPTPSLTDLDKSMNVLPMRIESSHVVSRKSLRPGEKSVEPLSTKESKSEFIRIATRPKTSQRATIKSSERRRISGRSNTGVLNTKGMPAKYDGNNRSTPMARGGAKSQGGAQSKILIGSKQIEVSAGDASRQAAPPIADAKSPVGSHKRSTGHASRERSQDGGAATPGVYKLEDDASHQVKYSGQRGFLRGRDPQGVLLQTTSLRAAQEIHRRKQEKEHESRFYNDYGAMVPASPAAARDTRSGVSSAPDYTAAQEIYHASPQLGQESQIVAEGEAAAPATATYGRASTQNQSLEQPRYSDKDAGMSPKSGKMLSTLDERLATSSAIRQTEMRTHQFSTYAPQRVQLQDRAATVTLIDKQTAGDMDTGMMSGSGPASVAPTPVMDPSGIPVPKGAKYSNTKNRDLSQVISKERMQSRSSGVRSNPDAENLLRGTGPEPTSSPGSGRIVVEQTDSPASRQEEVRQSFGIIHKRLRQITAENQRAPAGDDQLRPIMQPASSKDIKMSPHTLYNTKPSAKSIIGATAPAFGPHGSKTRLRSGHNRTVTMRDPDKLSQVLPGSQQLRASKKDTTPLKQESTFGRTHGALYLDKSDIELNQISSGHILAKDRLRDGPMLVTAGFGADSSVNLLRDDGKGGETGKSMSSPRKPELAKPTESSPERSMQLVENDDGADDEALITGPGQTVLRADSSITGDPTNQNMVTLALSKRSSVLNKRSVMVTAGQVTLGKVTDPSEREQLRASAGAPQIRQLNKAAHGRRLSAAVRGSFGSQPMPAGLITESFNARRSSQAARIGDVSPASSMQSHFLTYSNMKPRHGQHPRASDADPPRPTTMMANDPAAQQQQDQSTTPIDGRSQTGGVKKVSSRISLTIKTKRSAAAGFGGNSPPHPDEVQYVSVPGEIVEQLEDESKQMMTPTIEEANIHEQLTQLISQKSQRAVQTVLHDVRSLVGSHEELGAPSRATVEKTLSSRGVPHDKAHHRALLALKKEQDIPLPSGFFDKVAVMRKEAKHGRKMGSAYQIPMNGQGYVKLTSYERAMRGMQDELLSDIMRHRKELKTAKRKEKKESAMGGALASLLGVRKHGSILSAKTPSFSDAARMDFEAGLLAATQPAITAGSQVVSPPRPASVATISATVNLHKRRLQQNKQRRKEARNLNIAATQTRGGSAVHPPSFFSHVIGHDSLRRLQDTADNGSKSGGPDTRQVESASSDYNVTALARVVKPRAALSHISTVNRLSVHIMK